ncbi:MAG TPA: helix-turn-helix domain-containing protein [Gemmataceae bacterium]|nr:helix-turn-helix domain-containing protein [Gemmataceae bacterium]
MPPILSAPLQLLLAPRAAAAALSVSERTLWGLSAPRGPIPVVRLGRSVRYDLRDLEEFIAAQKGGAK